MISDLEQNYETEVEPRKKLNVTGLILTSIGGIFYLLTVFIVSQTETGANYPSSSWPFLIAGVISLMGTIIGAKNIKFGSVIILLSLPVTFLIGLIFSPYWHLYLYFITFVFVPIPLPHSVFVINGGILCLMSYKTKTN